MTASPFMLGMGLVFGAVKKVSSWCNLVTVSLSHLTDERDFSKRK